MKRLFPKFAAAWRATAIFESRPGYSRISRILVCVRHWLAGCDHRPELAPGDPEMPYRCKRCGVRFVQPW